MDDRQAAYRRSWLRAPLGEPAHQPGGEELASVLHLACEFYLRSEGALRREIRNSFSEWTAVRGRRTDLDVGFPARFRKICVLRGGRRTEARVSEVAPSLALELRRETRGPKQLPGMLRCFGV